MNMRCGGNVFDSNIENISLFLMETNLINPVIFKLVNANTACGI